MKILIVESSTTNAVALCRLLNERLESVSLRIASCPEDGFKQSMDFQADITILDLVFPDLSPRQIIRDFIRQFTPPVIVVSDLITPDRAGQDIALECFAYGAKGVFSDRGLIDEIHSFDGMIQSAKLIQAVTSAHLRHVMPQILLNTPAASD